MADSKKPSEKPTFDDISRLIENPSTKTKVEIAGKLAKQYKSGAFLPEELKLAEQIFNLLLKDAEIHIRRTLAHNLKEVKYLPHDLVLQLAHDVAEISLPMLEFSEMLTEDDLVLIITGTTEVTRQIAIANRKNLSGEVSSALIDTGNEEVVVNLLENHTARITGEGFNKIGINFSENEKILGALLSHSAATMEVAERVMGQISSGLQERLSEKYKETINRLGGIFEKSRESATIKFLGAKTTDEELMRLMNYISEKSGFAQELHNKNSKLAGMIESLELSGKLTPFTALCMGSMSLFEITLARLAKISIANTKKLATDEGGQGLKAVYQKALLPESMYGAVRLVVSVIRGIEKEKLEVKERLKRPENLANYLIEKIMAAAEGHEPEHLNYFLSMISLHAKSGNRA